MDDAQQNKLQNEKVSKLVISYALTTLIALLLNSVYTLLDSLFVSWGVGDNAMGGVSIVFPFVLVQSAIATALGGGAAAIISRQIGNKDFAGAGKTAFNARVIFYITAIIITAAGFALIKPMLKAFAATEELYQYAKDYYIIILIGNIFSTGFSAIIRAEGKMLYALLIWVIPITSNIILDAAFIFVLNLGVKGSAYGTVIGQFISLVMSVLFFLRFSALKQRKHKLNLKTIKEILLTGLPSLAQTGSLSLSLLLLNNILKYSSGTLAINTFAYVNKILMLAIIPFLALAQAIGPIIGYNNGAKKSERVRKTVELTMLIAVCYSLLSLILLEAVPNNLLMMFTKDPQVIELGVRAVRIIAVSILFMPFAMILGTACQAQGKKMPALLMFSVNLPYLAVCELAIVRLFGVNGVFIAYVAANALTALTSIIVYRIIGKRSILLQNNQ